MKIDAVDTEDHWDLETHAHDLCDKLRSEGHEPYYIPVSGTTPRSCLGYVRAGLELADQIEDRSLQLDAIYVPFGTGGIFTATLLVLRERGIRCPLIGISVNRNRDRCHEHFEHWWNALCELLHRDRTIHREPFEIYDEFIGREYGDPTDASLDAILLMAQSEGILLDPVYSGKTFSGLLAHHAAGRWASEHDLLMLHSGGVPALFAYHEEMKAHLIRRGICVDA